MSHAQPQAWHNFGANHTVSREHGCASSSNSKPQAYPRISTRPTSAPLSQTSFLAATFALTNWSHPEDNSAASVLSTSTRHSPTLSPATTTTGTMGSLGTYFLDVVYSFTNCMVCFPSSPQLKINSRSFKILRLLGEVSSDSCFSSFAHSD